MNKHILCGEEEGWFIVTCVVDLLMAETDSRHQIYSDHISSKHTICSVTSTSPFLVKLIGITVIEFYKIPIHDYSITEEALIALRCSLLL